MRILDIEYCLGRQQESDGSLKADNPTWDMQSLTEKTGVRVRHIAGADETALSLAVKAGDRLLSRFDRESIDGLVYVTQSPDSTIPATACLLHQQLRLPGKAFAFDLNQGCSGFVYGLGVAASLLELGQMERSLIICAETYGKYIEKGDRTCRPIFSDGASAVLLGKSGKGSIGPFIYQTDGTGAPNLTLKKSAQNPGKDVLFMDGPRVLMFTMSAVPKAVVHLLQRANMSIDDIDLFLFHQASRVVLDNIRRSVNIPEERFIRCLEDVGNTVSSTIPIALRKAMDAGEMRNGLNVLLMGFGVGYSLAGCILRT